MIFPGLDHRAPQDQYDAKAKRYFIMVLGLMALFVFLQLTQSASVLGAFTMALQVGFGYYTIKEDMDIWYVSAWGILCAIMNNVGLSHEIKWGNSSMAFKMTSTEEKLRALLAGNEGHHSGNGRLLTSETCQPAADPRNHDKAEDAVWVQFNISNGDKPDICQPGHYFLCSDSPMCYGECLGTDPNRYYRCYKKKTCMDPDCKCICGPSWNSHPDCDPEADICDPPMAYPHRFAGCCCEDCQCDAGYSSSRVDGCCTCKRCPPPDLLGAWISDGGSMQCWWTDGGRSLMPNLGLLVVAAVCLSMVLYL